MHPSQQVLEARVVAEGGTPSLLVDVEDSSELKRCPVHQDFSTPVVNGIQLDGELLHTFGKVRMLQGGFGDVVCRVVIESPNVRIRVEN